MKGFLEYCDGNSLFHRLNPLTKLIVSLLLCAVCFVNGSHFFIFAVILLNICIAASAGIMKLALNLLKGLGKLSIVLFIVQVLFVRSGNVLFTIPVINLGITDNGISFSLLLVMRLMAATLPLAIMLSVTQMTDLSNVMVSKLKIPYKYVFSIITVIRFIPVFSNEMSEIMEAQTARGVEFDTKNIFRKIKLIIPLCVPLLISSVRKIDTSAVSAELRGFNLRKSDSGYKKYSFAARDAAVLAVTAVIFALGIIL